MNTARFTLATALSALLLLAAVIPAANAGLFHKKERPADAAAKQIQTYQPPPVDAMHTRCEPLRQEVLKINHEPALVRGLMRPRTSWLMHRHEKCKQDLMGQEFDYLKHAGIEQTPSLPKLKTESAPAAAPAKPVENPSANSQGASPNASEQ